MMSKVLFSCPMRCHVGDPENAYVPALPVACKQSICAYGKRQERDDCRGSRKSAESGVRKP